MKKKRKLKEHKQPQVHEKLKGFELKIDKFGEIKSSLNIDQINQFLNENVKDKKLNDQNLPLKKNKE
ncbi:hypothetical protein N8301_05215 [Cyclobacteriaceae bacterium]|nr:hypothetical protein [Cyclobacteriaceae bacterium]